MKKIMVLAGMIATIMLVQSFDTNRNKISTPATYIDTLLKAELDKYYLEVIKSLNGRDTGMAHDVFKNLKTFSGASSLKVKHLLGVMRYWGSALGVSCTHCHNTADWASDEKQTKQVARQMYELRQTLNGKLLPAITGLQSAKPQINCGTCHRGKAIPKE